MREVNKAWLILIVGIFIVSGCKSSPTDPEEIDNSVIPVELRGVWKLISDRGNDIYIEVKSDGVDQYDYQGDESNSGADCYEVEIGKSILDYRRGDDYIFFFYQAQSTSKYTVNMVLEESDLKVERKYGEGRTSKYSKIAQATDTFVPHCE